MAEEAVQRWYVITTNTGYEDKVKSSLDKIAQNDQGLQPFESFIPIDEIQEIKNGKVRTVQRKREPGYVYVHMVMTNRSWFVVRNTTGVTGFVSMNKKPVPVSDEEVEALRDTKACVNIDVEVGTRVRVLGGVFANAEAKVIKVDAPSKRVTIGVEMFGKLVEAELGLDEVVRVLD